MPGHRKVCDCHGRANWTLRRKGNKLERVCPISHRDANKRWRKRNATKYRAYDRDRARKRYQAQKMLKEAASRDQAPCPACPGPCKGHHPSMLPYILGLRA